MIPARDDSTPARQLVCWVTRGHLVADVFGEALSWALPADRVLTTEWTEGTSPLELSSQERDEAPTGRTWVLLLAARGSLRAISLVSHDDRRDVAAHLRTALERYDRLAGARASGADRIARRTPDEWSLRPLEGDPPPTSDIPPRLDLPTDSPGAHRHSAPPALLPFDVPDHMTSEIDDCARSLAVTSRSFLLAAFALTLGRMSGSSSLTVGVEQRAPHDSVGATVIDGERLVPTRIDVDACLHPGAFVQAVDRSLRWSESCGITPDALDVLPAADETCTAPMQVSFGWRDLPEPEDIDRPVTILVEETGSTPVDVGLRVHAASGGLRGHVVRVNGLWDDEEAGAVVARMMRVLDELLASVRQGRPHHLLADVRAISAPDHDLLSRLNETSRLFPRMSLDALVREVSSERPNATAVRDAEHTLTYADLSAAAASQAERLRAAGTGAGDTVLVAVPRSAAEVIAVLGTVSAGAAYVGVDMTQPPAHIARIIERARPSVAIASSEEVAVLEELGVSAIPPWRPGDGDVVGDLEPVSDPDRLAYIAFTSGSSGDPKGVAVPHRAVVRLVHEARHLGLGPDERILRMAPLAFDASTFEIWGALVSGSSLEICPPERMSPNEIGTFLQERQITVAWMTAGLFRLVEQFAGEALAGLKRLLTGGDVVPHDNVRSALRDHPGLVITNGYGPTENTTFTTTYSVEEASMVTGPLPIGTPVPGTRVFVLDKDRRLLPPGAVGELYVGGVGLAQGYVDDQVETERFFGELSPDVSERVYRTGDLVRIDRKGLVHFLGRADDQVKVRGHRVQLEAITRALIAIDGVFDAVVLAVGEGAGDKRVLAALQLHPESGLTPAILRDHLRTRVPEHMVPQLWTVVEELPVTTNGKLDRMRLMAMSRPASSFRT